MTRPRQSTRPVDIAQVLEDAYAGDLNWVLAEDRDPYDFRGVVQRLFDLLELRHVDYVLVGGLAMLHYVEGRNTRDIDLVVSDDDVGRLPELEVTDRDPDFIRATFEGIRVDLLLTSNHLFREFRRRFVTTARFGERDIQCSTPEGLVFLKLFALPSTYRQARAARADIYEADVRALLRDCDIDTEPLLQLLATDMLP